MKLLAFHSVTIVKKIPHHLVLACIYVLSSSFSVSADDVKTVDTSIGHLQVENGRPV